MEIRFDGRNKDWYNICTALRGPDTKRIASSEDEFAYFMKKFTTARFRNITSIVGDGWCVVQYKSIVPSRDVNYAIRLARKLTERPPWWHHWHCHAFKGAKSIGKLYPEHIMEMDMIANMLRYIDHIFTRKEKC